MDSEAERAYAKFIEELKRSVYLDNLSPQVTESVLKSALDQYGCVKKIQFIPNYLEPNSSAYSALVELETAKQAADIVVELTAYPFMVSGMPRPVRVQVAKEEMFEERPVKPGRRIQICWVGPDDPDFEASHELKKVAKKHLAEDAYLHKRQVEKEENLSRTQDETLKAAYNKYEIMDRALIEKGERLEKHYGIKRPGGDAGY